MISTVDVETSYQKTKHGGMDPLPFNPKNILVSVGINDEYYFTNHSERIDEGCYHKIQAILDQTTLLIGHNIKFDRGLRDNKDWWGHGKRDTRNKNNLYLHHSCKPIEEINFKNQSDNQSNFIESCEEGYCGI